MAIDLLVIDHQIRALRIQKELGSMIHEITCVREEPNIKLEAHGRLAMAMTAYMQALEAVKNAECFVRLCGELTKD